MIMDGFKLKDYMVLYRNPESPNEAATKRYVDSFPTYYSIDQIGPGTIARANLVGAFGGDLVGFNQTDVYLSETGVTAGTYNRITVNNKGRVLQASTDSASVTPELHFANIIDKPTAASGYVGNVTDYAVKTSGNSSVIAMSGNIYTVTTPTVNNHAGTLKYLNGKLGAVVGKPKVGELIYTAPAVGRTGVLRANGGMVSKTTYSALYAAIGDKYTTTEISLSGQPWRQQYLFNTNTATAVSGWASFAISNNLSLHATSFATKNRVFSVGGFGSRDASMQLTWVSRMSSAPIDASGNVGAWSAVTPPPTVTLRTQVLVTKSKVYLIGGEDGTTVTNKVYSAVINADGSLGSWVTESPLPAAVCSSSLVVTSTKVYLLGGSGVSSQTSVIYSANLNSDGTIGVWASAGNIPVALSHTNSVVTKDRVYLIGGMSGYTPVSTVYTAPIDTNGAIGAWSTATALPSAAAMGTAFVTKSRVFLLGCTMTNTGDSYVSLSAPINLDGTLGSWATDTSAPSGFVAPTAVATSSKLYLLHGVTAAEDLVSYSAPFNGGLNDYMTSVIVQGSVGDQFKLPDYSQLSNGILEMYIQAT